MRESLTGHPELAAATIPATLATVGYIALAVHPGAAVSLATPPVLFVAGVTVVGWALLTINETGLRARI